MTAGPIKGFQRRRNYGAGKPKNQRGAYDEEEDFDDFSGSKRKGKNMLPRRRVEDDVDVEKTRKKTQLSCTERCSWSMIMFSAPECLQGGDDDHMLLCDICDSPAHSYCVGLGHEVPEEIGTVMVVGRPPFFP